MLQVLYMDIAKVDCDVVFVAMVYTRMLQASVTNVSSVFRTYVASVFIYMLHMFHTYVVSVLPGCCICLAMGFKCFSSVFYVFHLSSFIRCKCCIASGCFKSRYGVAHVIMVIHVCFRRMLQVFHLTYVLSVSFIASGCLSEYYIYFINILQAFQVRGGAL
jgi:hypothetical protein